MSDRQIVNSGELKHRLVVMFEDIQDDGVGGRLKKWLPVPFCLGGKTWANVKIASAYQKSTAQQDGQELTHIVTLRYKSWLLDSMAFYWPSRNRWLKILSVSAMDEETRLVTVRTQERIDLIQQGR